MEQRSIFQIYKELFYKYALDMMTKSAEYPDVERQFDALLLLGDRVLVACQEHPNFSRVWDVVNALDEIDQAIKSGNDPAKPAEDILVATELWLKFILWLVFPNKWSNLEGNKWFTLERVIRELDLLTSDEVQYSHEEYNKVTDVVRQFILRNYRYRNFIHETRDRSAPIRDNFLPAALVTLIAPLYKYHEAIKNRLMGLMIRPLAAVELKVVMKTIAGERREHLEHFAGREKWIKDLRQKLEGDLRKKGGYLLLTAEEGSGKSAICAKLTEELIQGIEPLGPYAETMRRIARWLPNTLLHFGKQSTNKPQEVARILIDQANTLLLNPVSLPDPSDNQDIGLSPELTFGRGFEPETSFLRKRQMRGLRDESASYALVREYGLEYQPEVLHTRRIQTAPNLDYYKRILYEVLDRVVIERGYIILVIDALDEISPDGRGLDFLPEQLPLGASALVTARPGPGINKWIQRNRHVERLRLNELTRDEIPQLTGVSDNDGEAHKEFNNKVWNNSDGWALMVSDVAKSVRENHGNFNLARIEGSVDDILERQANEWQSYPIQNGLDPLREILLLMAVFEPATPLHLNLIQFFLEHRHIRLSNQELRNLLQSVRAQLKGFDADRIKLGIKAFAEYIRDRHCSPRELRRTLESVVAWLAEDEEVDNETVARFLQYWTDPKQVRDEHFRSIAERLVEALIEDRKAAETLRKIASITWPEKGVSPLAIRCLRAAAQLGSRAAMGNLGNRLLDGEGVPQNKEEGEHWLYKAAEAGHELSMVTLGQRLVEGDELTKNTKEGEKWLRKASEANYELAMLVLGSRQISGRDLPENRNEGVDWLRKAAEVKNFSPAMFVLGNFLLTNSELAQNTGEGEKWLLKAANVGEANAMYILGNRLLEGEDLTEDRQEGERWLRKAAEANHAPAMRNLGIRLLDGEGLIQNTDEGREWLEKAVKADDQIAMYRLGNRLLDGYGLPQDNKQGKELLLNLAKKEFAPAMDSLGRRLLDGRGLPQNSKEGKQWLQKAAKANYPPSMYHIGRYLLEGKGIAQNTNEGEKWLRRALEEGYPTAMAYFGNCLLDGDRLPKNSAEGEKWLRQAVEAGEEQAMRVLGVRLLEGDGLAKNSEEGEKWLRQAAEAGEVQAMLNLGVRLLEGDGLAKNSEEGEKWLRKAAGTNTPQAMRILGDQLLDGDSLAGNSEEGEKWLRKAAETNDTEAMRILGNRLLDGVGLVKSGEEGEKWLRKAAEKREVRAMEELGDRLIKGKGLFKRVSEGARWLRKAADEGYIPAIGNLGYRYLNGEGLPQNKARGKEYLVKIENSKNAEEMTVIGQRRYEIGDYKSAFEFFLRGFNLGSEDARNDLAYMIRRSEVPLDATPPYTAIELLRVLVEKNHSVGTVNYALCLATGFQCSEDWKAADQLITRIKKGSGVFQWWYDLVKKDDPEGDLVVGWLARHRLIDDPDGLTVAERLGRARAGGWRVPEWMDETVR